MSENNIRKISQDMDAYRKAIENAEAALAEAERELTIALAECEDREHGETAAALDAQPAAENAEAMEAYEAQLAEENAAVMEAYEAQLAEENAAAMEAYEAQLAEENAEVMEAYEAQLAEENAEAMEAYEAQLAEENAEAMASYSDDDGITEEYVARGEGCIIDDDGNWVSVDDDRLDAYPEYWKD